MDTNATPQSTVKVDQWAIDRAHFLADKRGVDHFVTLDKDGAYGIFSQAFIDQRGTEDRPAWENQILVRVTPEGEVVR